MKIIAVYNDMVSADHIGSKILVWPDSVMIDSGKPLFFPEGNDMLILGIGAKIDAVGKSIRPKFAHRYFKDIFPMAFILRQNVARQILIGEDPKACDIVSDYCIIHGTSFVEDIPDLLKLHLSLSSLKIEEQSFKFDIEIKDTSGRINKAIASASTVNTLKTGDIVAFFSDFATLIEHDSLLRVASSNNNVLIENKLK